MIKQNHWVRHLQPGDEVTWNDPDGGTCNHTGIISEIEYFGDDDNFARITMQDGWHAEVMLQELS